MGTAYTLPVKYIELDMDLAFHRDECYGIRSNAGWPRLCYPVLYAAPVHLWVTSSNNQWGPSMGTVIPSMGPINGAHQWGPARFKQWGHDGIGYALGVCYVVLPVPASYSMPRNAGTQCLVQSDLTNTHQRQLCNNHQWGPTDSLKR